MKSLVPHAPRALMACSLVVGLAHVAVAGRPGGEAHRGVVRAAAPADPCGGELELIADDPGFAERMGFSVAISGDTLVAGAPGVVGVPGSVHVFVRSGGSWVEEQQISSPAGPIDDFFGYSVGVSGDSMIVGAFRDESAYVFKRMGGVWSLEQRLTASDADGGDLFGHAVSISGDTLVVGAHGNVGGVSHRGAACVFVRVGGAWSEQQKLTSSDPQWGNAIFGNSVSVDGDAVAIADEQADLGGGAIYMFVRSGGTWTEQQKLSATDAAAHDRLGRSVSLFGATLLAGAERDDLPNCQACGSAYVFERAGGTWFEQQKLVASDGEALDVFGVSVALGQDVAIVGAPFAGEGGAGYIYTRCAGSWTEVQKLTASDPRGSHQLGASAGISRGLVVLGSSEDDSGAPRAGSVYAFECVVRPCAAAPECSAGGPYAAQCDGVAMAGAFAEDPDGDPLTFLWESDCDQDGVFGEPGDGSFDDDSVLDAVFRAPDPCGSSCTVRLTVDDGSGTCTSVASVSVDDTTPPVLSLLPPDATVECPAPPPPVVTALDNCAGAVPVSFTEEILPRVDLSGCADGEREGYIDLAQFPDIAGCSGGWSIPGILSTTLAPACGHQAGDDSANPLGFDCDVADICAPGWHVAASADEVTTHDPTGGAGAVPLGEQLFFATRQSGTGCGICATGANLANPPCNGGSCVVGCAQTDFTSNDVFGVGNIGAIPNAATCFGLNRFSNDACFSLGPPWSCAGNGENEAHVLTKTSPAAGGVVCVPDAPGGLDCPQDHVIRRTWRAVDACGNAVVHVQILTVVDTTAPVITPGALAPCYTSVEDALDAALAVTQVVDACGGAVEVTHATRLVGCDLSIVLTASDECDHVSSFAYETIVDTTPPVVTPAGDVFCLWPPNHWWVCFSRDEFHFEVTDDCLGPVTWSFDDCSSNQPENDIGDGNTGPDCIVSPDGEQVCVRAERQGGDKAGRTYGVGVVAMDSCGNASQQAVGMIFVPHDAREHLECLRTTRVGQRPRVGGRR